MDKKKFSFSGWSLKEFSKGRKRLIVTLVGAVVTFIVTNKPELTVIVGALSEMLFSMVEYYLKDE